MTSGASAHSPATRSAVVVVVGSVVVVPGVVVVVGAVDVFAGSGVVAVGLVDVDEVESAASPELQATANNASKRRSLRMTATT